MMQRRMKGDGGRRLDVGDEKNAEDDKDES
jgi:hypothetical protein